MPTTVTERAEEAEAVVAAAVEEEAGAAPR